MTSSTDYEPPVFNENNKYDNQPREECASCLEVLSRRPFVICADCKKDPTICLQCFSRGKEFEYHSNDHQYRLCTSLTELQGISGIWSAKEELELIDSVLQSGYGNWEDVAKTVSGRTPRECRELFNDVFIDNVQSRFSSSLVSRMIRDETTIVERIQPCHQLQVTTYPFRPSETLSTSELCGYNAFRGDFSVECHDKAELELCHVIVPDDEEDDDSEENEYDDYNDEDHRLQRALSVAMAEGYNDRLRDRCRVKAVVREFSLLNKHKLRHFLNYYDNLMEDIGRKKNRDTLIKMARLLCAYDFDFLLEGLKLQQSLVLAINQLSECRENGLQYSDERELFQVLKRRRLSAKAEPPRPLLETLSSLETASAIVATKRAPNDLDIVNMVGYERLSVEERSLCSQVRIEPKRFLELKTRMQEERERLERPLKLKEARQLFKIDVNKTRRLMDFWNHRST